MEGPHEAEETALSAFKRGYRDDLRVELWEKKESVRSKVTPRKVGEALKDKGLPNSEREGRKEASRVLVLKKETSHLAGFRGSCH